MRPRPHRTPEEERAARGLWRAYKLRRDAVRVLLMIPVLGAVMLAIATVLQELALALERRADRAERSFMARWPAPQPPSCARCPDDCEDGRDDEGSECETCEGLGRVTFQSHAAILAGRMGGTPSGDNTARRVAIRAKYPRLLPEEVERVLAAWGRERKEG